MKDFLAFIGFFALFAIGACIIVGVCYEIKEWILGLKYEYRIKHRFDKPPTAACYCKDCTRHDNESGRCYKFDRWHTADNWFCWDATPRKKEAEDVVQ